MDIIWTRQALRSLESIADYIARDNPQAAYEVTEAIRRTALLLGNFPQLGRTGRRAGTRQRPVAGLPYVLIYRLRGAAWETTLVTQTCGYISGAVARLKRHA